MTPMSQIPRASETAHTAEIAAQARREPVAPASKSQKAGEGRIVLDQSPTTTVSPGHVAIYDVRNNRVIIKSPPPTDLAKA